jgi:hypothetical protein
MEHGPYGASAYGRNRWTARSTGRTSVVSAGVVPPATRPGEEAGDLVGFLMVLAEE